ncbi:hypothetical protein Tco_1041781 [Tanacetum coccineum]|uniref:Uncharacterized protein n=1 Tax=Tanacetum coccineum TaxID=301880 RepID=A0ABQ5GIL0_9ASTR
MALDTNCRIILTQVWIDSLRVLERERWLDEHERINAIDADEDITLVNDQDDADMFDVNTLTGDEVLAEQEVATKDVNLTVDEVTLDQALDALKSVKPKVKANVVEEPSVPVSVASIKAKVQDKGKGILVEEPVKPKKKDLISLDEENALKLQAEFDEEERLAREKYEANVALTEEWDDIQAKVEALFKLAQECTLKQEARELTDEEKTRLFLKFLEQRRKHFAAKKAEEKRNKPPTQAQQRKSCKMFDRAFKLVNTFVDFRTDLVEGSSKRAGDELEQEVTKKQKVDDVQETAKVDDDQETAKIKELMKIVFDEEEVAIYAIPLATKPPSIVDLVKAKYGSTRPVEDLDLILYGDLKTMFEPRVEDQGRIVRIKRLLYDIRVTAAQVCVTAAKLKTAKLRNDILMFQQHQGESLSEAWTRFKDLLQKFPHHGIDLWLQV